MRSIIIALVSAVAVAAQSASTETRQFTTLTGSAASIAFTTASSSITETGTASSGTASSSSATITPGSTSTITLLEGGGLGLVTATVVNGTTTVFPNTTATATHSSTNGTSSTSTSAAPTNTQPCNGWPEFCERSYSNITQVAAHNAAFAIKGNAASNQEYGMTQQLNDGIRMLTGEVHWVNNTMYNCHTSCNLLNAGTWQSGLEEIATWVRSNPYDVVTILVVNSDYRPVTDFVSAVQGSGLAPYLYTPPKTPMRLGDWPTLSSMILSQKRVVMFMDYNANATAVPYIIDEFASIWETPFSPENISFPCTVQRPPTLTNLTEAADDWMYLANHNLNTAIAFAGESFLIPNTAEINNTNAAGNDTGMLGQMAATCYSDYGRAPNWLLVDYYDRVAGSVFQVAAKYNGVTYNKACCGVATSGAFGLGERQNMLGMLVALFAIAGWMLMV